MQLSNARAFDIGNAGFGSGMIRLMRLLVVEDNRTLAESVAKIFRAKGYAVDTVEMGDDLVDDHGRAARVDENLAVRCEGDRIVVGAIDVCSRGHRKRLGGEWTFVHSVLGGNAMLVA